MIKNLHAVAGVLLPLLVSLGGTAYGQLTPRPNPPSTMTTPVVTQPLPKTKQNPTINPSMTSASTEKMQAAFRQVIGREALRGELQEATKYVLKGVTYYCIPPTAIADTDPPSKVKRTEWFCESPIMSWLYDTPAGQTEYRSVYARAVKEAYGLNVDPMPLSKVKPEKSFFTGEVGHHVLLTQFTGSLYVNSSSKLHLPIGTEVLKALADAFKGSSNSAATKKDPLSLEATVERAFIQALNRQPSEADIKALIPIFTKEKAAHRRMVEIVKGLDGLKNLKV